MNKDLFRYRSKYSDYQDCYFRVNKYADGNHRLDIISCTEGPICTVTTTVGQKIPEDMIMVKDYSENEGVLKWLATEDYIDEIVGYATSGFVQIPICHLTEKGLKLVGEE